MPADLTGGGYDIQALPVVSTPASPAADIPHPAPSSSPGPNAEPPAPASPSVFQDPGFQEPGFQDPDAPTRSGATVPMAAVALSQSPSDTQGAPVDHGSTQGQTNAPATGQTAGQPTAQVQHATFSSDTAEADETEHTLTSIKDWNGLIGHLLGRVEMATNALVRGALLHRVARVFERHLKDPERAFVTLQSAFAESPDSKDLILELDQLGNALGRLGELAEPGYQALLSPPPTCPNHRKRRF